MTIQFGNWRLVPRDRLNWELERFCKVEGRGSNAAYPEPTWRSVGRYYSAATFPLALRFAADCELRDEGGTRSVGIQDALDRYERILSDFTMAFERICSGPEATQTTIHD